MNGFNHQNQLQELIERRQPVEVRFFDTPEVFNVAYILNSNQEYLTLLEITPESTFDGICIYPTNRISSIKFDTDYLSALDTTAQEITLLDHASFLKSAIKDYTFDGFLAAAKKTDTLIELMTFDNETIAGHVLDFDDEVIMINEFFAENSQKASQALIYKTTLIRLAVEVPWLLEIKKFLNN